MFNSTTATKLEYTDGRDTSIRPASSILPEKIDPEKAFSELQKLYGNDTLFKLGLKNGEISDHDFSIIVGTILTFIESYYPDNFDLLDATKQIRNIMHRNPNGSGDEIIKFLSGLCYGDQKIHAKKRTT